ncbi:hypothetical protein VKI22_16355 [Cyanobacterium aponinum UTEX 3221]|nr:hypothetical protein [Cyanobacterium aponinum]WRL38172.1 hypothetical protein VKI22_16355 [Cyanobacterium aponinum UTEX 3221]
MWKPSNPIDDIINTLDEYEKNPESFKSKNNDTALYAREEARKRVREACN